MPGPPTLPGQDINLPSDRLDDFQLFQLVNKEATANGLDPAMVYHVVKQESGGKNFQTSGKGAQGYMQLMPGTAKQYGVTDPMDPQQNIRAGVRYLADLHKKSGGDWRKTLSSYNAGPAASARYGGVAPYPETQDYIKRIMGTTPQVGQPPPQAPPPETTTLPPDQEQAFQQWAKQNGIADVNSPESRYDYRGFWQDTKGAPHPPGSQQHFPDTFKQHGHPTFSVESKYSKGPGDGGTWNGDQFVPAASPASPAQAPASAPPQDEFAAWKASQQAPAATPAETERPSMHALGSMWDTAKNLASAVDPRTTEGQRNIAGGAAGLATAVATEGMSAIPAALMAVGGAGVGGGLAAAAQGKDEEVPGALRQQAGQEAIGQGLAWPLQAVGRRLLASPVSKAAAEGLSDAKQAVIDRLQPVLDSAQDALRSTRNQAARGLRAARASASDALGSVRESATRTMEAAQAHAKRGVEAARAAIPGAPPVAPELEAANTAYADMVNRPPPSSSQVGRDAQAVITGPAKTAKDALGAAVGEAAKTGPMRPTAKLKTEAQNFIDQLLGPSAEAFPHIAPEGAGVTGEYADAIGRLSPEARAAVEAQLPEQSVDPIIKHPIMGIVRRILNAPENVSFEAMHAFKQELNDAVLGTADKSQLKRVTTMTQHLSTTLRDTLKEAGHAPYESATAAYQQVAQLFGKDTIAADLKSVAKTNPEALISLVKGNEPTKLGMFKELLTKRAAEGGDEAAGQAAWNNFRSAWTHKNILKGGIEGLKDRMGKLDPEFADTLFGDESGKMIRQNLQTLSNAYDDAIAKGTIANAAQLEAAKTAEAGVAAARKSGADLLKTTKRLNRQGVQEAQTEAGAKVEGARVEANQQVGYAQGQADTARRALTTAKAPTAEELKFQRSTLAPKNVQSAEQVGANVLRAATLGPGSIWGGLSLARLLKGPKAADLIEWAAYSPKHTQMLVKAMTSTVPGTLVADVIRASGLGPLDTGRSAPPSMSIEDALSGKAGTPPPSVSPALQNAITGPPKAP